MPLFLLYFCIAHHPCHDIQTNDEASRDRLAVVAAFKQNFPSLIGTAIDSSIRMGFYRTLSDTSCGLWWRSNKIGPFRVSCGFILFSLHFCHSSLSFSCSMIPQRVKKMANVAEHHVVDAKKFVFSMGRRTMSTVSMNSSTTSSSTATQPSDDDPKSSKPIKAKTTLGHPTRSGSDSSLMANTLLWTHLIPPMPVIASTMYRHYAKGM